MVTVGDPVEKPEPDPEGKGRGQRSGLIPFTSETAKAASMRAQAARRARAADPRLAMLDAMRDITVKERAALAVDPAKAKGYLALVAELEAYEQQQYGGRGEGGTSSTPGAQAAVTEEEWQGLWESPEAKPEENVRAD
jgi:hypothetical protein